MSLTGRIEKLLSDTKTLLSKQENVRKVCQEIARALQLQDPPGEQPATELSHACIGDCTRARLELGLIESKLLRAHTVCTVFGRVSSGKSALLNAMIGAEILPSESQPTTNSFVKIQKSADDTDYVIFSNDAEKNDISSLSRVDETEDNCLPTGSNVMVYYSATKCSLLNNNVVLVDTPGNGSTDGIDTLIQKQCTESDIIILVLAGTGTFSDADKNFITQFSTNYTQYNIIIVYNMADKIRKKVDDSKKKLSNEINNYLCGTLKVKKNRDNERIFFLSAKERLNILTCENYKSKQAGWELRNEEFNNFVDYFKEMLIELSNEKNIIPTMRRNIEIIDKTFDCVRSYKSDIEKSIKEKYQDLEKLKKKIEKEISSLFDEEYENVFHYALMHTKVDKSNKKIKVDKLDRKIKVDDLNEEICMDELNTIVNNQDHFQTYLKELMTIMVEKYKTIVKDTVNLEYGKDEILIKIIEKVYFPSYFNYIVQIQDEDVSDLRSNFLEIAEIILKFRVLTIAGTAIGTAAVLAVIGATAGVLAPISTALFAPIFSASGGLIGFSAGGGASFATTGGKVVERVLFKERYKNKEVLKKWWESKKKLLIDSYEKFTTCLDDDVKRIISEFVELEKETDNFHKSWADLVIKEDRIR